MRYLCLIVSLFSFAFAQDAFLTVKFSVETVNANVLEKKAMQNDSSQVDTTESILIELSDMSREINYEGQKQIQPLQRTVKEGGDQLPILPTLNEVSYNLLEPKD